MMTELARGSSDQPGTPLVERVGFLVSQLGFLGADGCAVGRRVLGWPPRHFGLLTHLAANDGQTQQRLADTMGVHRNAMVGLIDDLEDRGLVQRRRHPADRRAHAVHLTDSARDLLNEAQAAADAHDAELLAGLDGADRRHLVRLLRHMAEHAGLAPDVHPDLREPSQHTSTGAREPRPFPR
jgi:DNA-binding MarR family transcriptional regulator